MKRFGDFSTINIPTASFRAKAVTYISIVVELLRKTSISTARREEMEESKNVTKMAFQ